MAIDGNRPYDTWEEDVRRFSDSARLISASQLDVPLDGGWTPRQIIGHLLDSELMFGLRLRTALATPGATVQAFQQESLATDVPYGDLDLDEVLAALVALRRVNVELLRAAPASAWNRSILHPEFGEQSLEQVVAVFTNHVGEHYRDLLPLLSATGS